MPGRTPRRRQRIRLGELPGDDREGFPRWGIRGDTVGLANPDADGAAVGRTGAMMDGVGTSQSAQQKKSEAADKGYPLAVPDFAHGQGEVLSDRPPARQIVVPAGFRMSGSGRRNFRRPPPRVP